MPNLTHLSEAWRIFKRSVRVKRKGIKKYSGSAKEICGQIIKDCWNGRYFQTSSDDGHFCEFYIRDFGWCVDSLLKLGYKKEVKKTLAYALEKYSRQRLTTTITPSGKCIDIFIYSPDSLAYLIRSLRAAEAFDLIKRYKDFLIKEIKRCFGLCFDKEKSLVRADKYFGAMKDEAKRSSSTYDNVMIAMLSDELNRLNFYNPFKEYDAKKAVKENLWNGEYFYDDLNKHNIVTGDSNVIPFWTGVFDDRKMLKSCIKSIQNAGLDNPFPLKYSPGRFKEHKLNFVSLFVPGYQKEGIKMHMGPMFVQLVKQVDGKKAKKYIDSYTKIIEKYKNFLEVFNPDGTPFKSPFYYADEGMLWAANYLAISL
jgi:hypothetical protein